MKTLLITTHAPTENTQKLAHACILGAYAEETNLNIIVKTALETTADHVLTADGIIIGTTENIGYMGGLTKDFFDRIYYPVLEQKQGLPIATYVRAGLDGTGTIRALQSIVIGLKWQWIQAPTILKGNWQPSFLDTVTHLGTSIAVGLDAGIF